MCTKVCPHGVFEFIGKQVHIVGRDFCMECGACKKNCPQGAVMLDVGDGCGCAAGIIQGKLKGTKPACGCTEQANCN
jgi:Fe-S-cluster-containing hydrogenase component 2